ncbi:MAG TPA: CcmD family protein [Vicinamibacterales bacterium]|nr:CcmD family protein [Vicinamibacterales bacterium]
MNRVTRVVRPIGRVGQWAQAVVQVMVLLIALAIPASVDATQPQPPKEFVPVDEVPPGEQIPAINLVAAAYGFVWLAVLGYVWSIARRLKTVETELADLESRRR